MSLRPSRLRAQLTDLIPPSVFGQMSARLLLARLAGLSAGRRRVFSSAGLSFVLVLASGISTLGLIGCASSPVKPEATVVGDVGSAAGQWRGKALLRNLQTGKSGTLSLDIIAQEPSRMRMDVTGMMGVYVASFAMKEARVQYILAQQKKFVTAPADASALHDLVPIRIAPQDLSRILFDRALPKNAWECQMDERGQPSACVHGGDGIRVTWLERAGGHRKFKIESGTAEATLVLDESKAKVEPTGDVYSLQAPAGYRQETHESKL